MPQGTCKWFKKDKGFGFITEDNTNQDCFIHFSNIIPEEEGAFRFLDIGDRVAFEKQKTEKGWMAVKARKV